MSFFDELVKKIFPGDEKETFTVKQPLKRNDKFIREYNLWKEADRRILCLELVYQSYVQKKQGEESEISLHFHNTQYGNGIVIEFSRHMGKKEFTFLLDYFKEKVLSSGYSLYLSDEKITEKNSEIITIERHYLKPALYATPGVKSEQLYGNITLELLRYNDTPAYIKVFSGIYSDSAYYPPLDFEDFIEYLLE